MATADFAGLWAELRSRVEYEAEYARDEAHRLRRIRDDGELIDHHRYDAEAGALARVLLWMDEIGPDEGEL